MLLEHLPAPIVQPAPHWPTAATSWGLPTPLPALFVCSSLVGGLWGWWKRWHMDSCLRSFRSWLWGGQGLPTVDVISHS